METTITPAEIRQGDTLLNANGEVEWVAFTGAVPRIEDGQSVGVAAFVLVTEGGPEICIWPTDSTALFAAVVRGAGIRTITQVTEGAMVRTL